MFNGKSDDGTKKKKTETVTKKTEQTEQEPILDSMPIANDTSGIENIESKKDSGRTIKGFIEPDVTQLPDNKDLLESVNVVPIPEAPAPKQDEPLDLLPIDPIDPTAPLPDN